MKRIIVFGMRFVIFCFVSSLMLASCQNTKVLLPQAKVTVIAEIKDQSPVYFFLKMEEKDTLIEVKTKNSGSVTNRIFFIDTRLSLRKVISEIKNIQANKDESTQECKIPENYFAYTDTIKNAIAFLPFTKVNYKLEKPDFNLTYFYLDRNDLVHFKDEVFSKNEVQAFINNLFTEHKSRIVFSYDKGMSFGKYIQYQFFIENLIITKKGVTRNNNKEYIY